MRESINEWMERRREWDDHVTRMESERLVKISRDNTMQLPEEDLKDVRKEDGAT